MMRAVIAAALLAGATVAAADGPMPSPRYGAFQLSFETYRPRIDSEFGGRATPYESAFGGKRNIMFRFDVAYVVFVDHGSLEVGGGAGYWEKYGHGFQLDGSPSSDPTALKVVPLRGSVTYRYDVLSNQYRWMPLAPYARFSIDRYQWWVNNGTGNTATANGTSGSGATWGYTLTGGIAIDLGAIDPDLAREADRDSGVNHTYLFFEVSKSSVKDFGSSSSWNLSDDRSVSVAGGLLLAF